MIQQNASSGEEMASTSEELASQAEQLESAIEFFKLTENGDNNGKSVYKEYSELSRNKLAKKTEYRQLKARGKSDNQHAVVIELDGNGTESDLLDSDFEKY